MSGHDLKRAFFFYGGLMLVAFPFLAGRTIWVPVACLAVWGLSRLSESAGKSEGIGRLREQVDRFFRSRRKAIAALAVIAAVAAPFFGVSDYVLDVLIGATLYAILATALNITVGLTGVLVLGFIGFYAIGAYTTGILTAKFHLCGFWIALPLSGLAAMTAGLLLGIPTLRLKGDYLAIVTLGFGEIVRIFLTNMNGLTGGPNGILGISRPQLFGLSVTSPRSFYWFCLAFLVVIAVVVGNIIASRYGRSWIAMRENEMAASALGIDPFRRHLLSFSLSAFFAGIAGSLFAVKQGFISPDSFTFYESVLVLCMVVIGGIGNLAGSIAGAVLLTTTPEFLREFALYRMLIFGVVMIAFMVYRPHGLLGSRAISQEVEDSHDAE